MTVLASETIKRKSQKSKFNDEFENYLKNQCLKTTFNGIEVETFSWYKKNNKPIIIYHKHHPSIPYYHRHGYAYTITQALRNIESHDRYVLSGFAKYNK